LIKLQLLIQKLITFNHMDEINKYSSVLQIRSTLFVPEQATWF